MNDAPTLSQRADALEDQMSRELDYLVVKSRLYTMADGDMGPPPNTPTMMAANPSDAPSKTPHRNCPLLRHLSHANVANSTNISSGSWAIVITDSVRNMGQQISSNTASHAAGELISSEAIRCSKKITAPAIAIDVTHAGKCSQIPGT